VPPIFNKRAELEARLGSSGAVRRPEPEDQVEEPTVVETPTEPAPPAVAELPERPPERRPLPRTWGEDEGTVLAPGTILEGTLRAAEPVKLGGTLQGALEAEGPVVVQEGGRLMARVVAPEVVVAGFVDGRVQCHGRLEVRATGLVKGKLHVGTLRIEEGALLDGQLQMAGATTAAAIRTPDPQPVPDLPRPRPSKAPRVDEPAGDAAPEPIAVSQ